VDVCFFPPEYIASHNTGGQNYLSGAANIIREIGKFNVIMNYYMKHKAEGGCNVTFSCRYWIYDFV